MSGEATNGEKITGVGTTAAEGNVFCNMLNVKNTGAETATNVTITANISETAVTSGKNYLRVALVPSDCTADTGRGTATVASAQEFRDNIYSAGADAAKPVEYVGAGVADREGAIKAAAKDVQTMVTQSLLMLVILIRMMLSTICLSYGLKARMWIARMHMLVTICQTSLSQLQLTNL